MLEFAMQQRLQSDKALELECDALLKDMITYALNCANKLSRSVSTGLVFNLESFQAYADNITSNRPDLEPGDLSSVSREKLKVAVDKLIKLNTLIINDLNELLTEQSKLHNPYSFQLEALI